MSKIHRSEPTPAPQSPAVTESEVAAASRLNPRSLIEDHRECWRRGERMPVEAYLERFRPSGVDAAELLDLIYNEVVLREEDGESPQLDEYLDRFPMHDEALRAQFEVHQFLRTSGSFTITLSTDICRLFRVAGRTAGPGNRDLSHSCDHRSRTPVSQSASRAGLEIAAPRITGRRGTPHSPDPSWPRVEGFDILGVLGSGGMGTVYRAFDRKSGHPVALKTINRVGATTLLRFKQEFRTLLDVAHPNLVTLYELICDGQNWFLTMELLDGVDFLRHVKADHPSRGQSTPLRAALRQLAEGIAALHVAGQAAPRRQALKRDRKPTTAGSYCWISASPPSRVRTVSTAARKSISSERRHTWPPSKRPTRRSRRRATGTAWG